MIILSNSSYKGTVARSLTRIISSIPTALGEIRHLICKEVLFSAPIVIFTSKDFYLLGEINEKIGILQSTGLISFWQLQCFNHDLLKIKSKKQPNVLTLNHLNGCFHILLLGFALSSVCFIIEVFLKQIAVHVV